MLKNKKILGEIAVLLSAVLWGGIGIFTRNLKSFGFSAYQISFVRALLTSFILFVYILIKDYKLLKFKLCDIWMFIGTGILSFAFFNVCYMMSIEENSLSVACVLMYTSPIWVNLISAFLFNEKLNLKKIISLVMCFGGCVAICISPSAKLTKLGLLVGLLSGIGYALYSIFGKIASKKYSTLTVTLYTFVFAALALSPISKITTIPSKIHGAKEIFFLVGAAVVCTIMPYLLYTFGLSKIDAGKASVLSIIEPAVAAVVGAVVYKEKIGLLCVAGMLVILFGLVLQNGKRENAENTEK